MKRTQTMQTLLETGQRPKIPRCASGTPTLARSEPSIVKTERMLVVHHLIDFKTALDWKTCRRLLAKVDKAAISAQAHDMLAADSTSEETPKHLFKDLVKPKRKFNIAAITAHVRATKTQRQQPPAAVVGQRPAREPVLPMTVQGMNRRWVMVKFQGAPRVHLLPETGETPLCRRRRGSVGKPLVRLEGSGTGINYLNSTNWGIDCLYDLRADAPRSRVSGHQLSGWPSAQHVHKTR